MANTIIQIKRSQANTPSSLNYGELAYSFASNTLYIGANTGVPVSVTDQATANIARQAYNQANAAYDEANAAYVAANVAYNAANTVAVYANDEIVYSNAYLNFLNTSTVLVDVKQNLQSEFANISFTVNPDTVVYTSGSVMTGPLQINYAGTGLTVNTDVEIGNTVSVGSTVVTNALAFNSYQLTSNVATISDNSPHVIDQFPSNLYTTVKYIFQITSSVGIHSTEVLCMQDGVKTYIAEYATMISGNYLGSFDFILSGSNAQLVFTPINPSNNILTIKIIRYGITT
jgi:hypothetical protein